MLFKSLVAHYFTHTKNLLVPSFLQYKIDRYRSVHLTPKTIIDESQLKPYIENLMKIQIQGNKACNVDEQTNAVWIHLKQQNLGLTQYLCRNGFSIHHGIGSQISLWRWISSQKDLVTPYSTCYVSAGAILIKDDKILLVQQKNGPRVGQYGIPGGRTDFGESIYSCSERELFEQTNIRAKFSYILHFRELEKTAYGAMDIYFACVMKYDQDAFKDIKICQRQLSSYEWVPLSEYQGFAKKNSIGTQYQLASYISKLYKSGYNFENQIANETSIEYYTSPIDNTRRSVIQHGLVTGISIQKIYGDKSS